MYSEFVLVAIVALCAIIGLISTVRWLDVRRRGVANRAGSATGCPGTTYHRCVAGRPH